MMRPKYILLIKLICNLTQAARQLFLHWRRVKKKSKGKKGVREQEREFSRRHNVKRNRGGNDQLKWTTII